MIKSYSTKRALLQPDYLKTFIKLYLYMRRDPNFSLIRSLKALSIFRHERVVEHDKKIIVTSLFPPVPTKAFFRIFENHTSSNPFQDFAKCNRQSPTTIHIALTNECMYRCRHCCNRFKGKNEMNTHEITDLLSQLQDMGVSLIGFTGGEPLLREDLVEIIKAVDDRSITILLTTGYGLSREKARELKNAGLFATLISLDSSKEEIHDKNRGFNGAFRIALKAIENSREEGLYTMIATVATNRNIRDGDLENLFELGKKLDVHEIRVGDMIPTGSLINSSPHDLLSSESRKMLKDVHIKYSKKGGYPKISVFSYIESEKLFGCTAGVFHSYIDAEGNLYPCDFVPISFGNVREKPIKELWREMRETMKHPKRSCFAFENHKIIKEEFKGKLPLDKTIIERISKKKWFMEKPDFFRTLLGEI